VSLNVAALEHRIPPPVVAAAVAAGMWGVAGLGPRLPLAPDLAWWAGMALTVAGVAVALMGVQSFRASRTTVNPLEPERASALVTGGVYRVTRNPMYVGMALLLTGWAVGLRAVLPFAGIAAFVLFITRFQIFPEEVGLSGPALHRCVRPPRRTLADRRLPGLRGGAMIVPSRAAFCTAATAGDHESVATMLAAAPELVHAAGGHDKTALHLAAEKDHIEVARVLLDAGADLEAKTSWGATPLAWAAVMGSGRVADELMARGATGYTIEVAAALGHADFVGYMTAKGGLSDHRVRDAAFHAAARNGHPALVAFLLDCRADVDARGFFDAPAVHWAAHNGHADTVRLLIARGADPMLKDTRFDATAAAWAEENGHTAIAEALRAPRPGR
jgi:protein-S-isoprenylcysteine O-methyltransferase Ste14